MSVTDRKRNGDTDTDTRALRCTCHRRDRSIEDQLTGETIVCILVRAETLGALTKRRTKRLDRSRTSLSGRRAHFAYPHERRCLDSRGRRGRGYVSRAGRGPDQAEEARNQRKAAHKLYCLLWQRRSHHRPMQLSRAPATRQGIIVAMTRRAIETDRAPAAIGPYSQAIQAGEFLFCSGQIPLDPITGEMVGDDAATQAEQVLRNLSALLEAAGLGLGDVVKATIFLTDMGDFDAVNKVYSRSFSGFAPPARACVEVSALPKGAKVEIEAIARHEE